jgi:hypothetical protein
MKKKTTGMTRTAVRDLFVAELARRGVACAPLEDGAYRIEACGGDLTVSLENLARDLARDHDALRVVRFVDAVLAPREVLPWPEAQIHVYWSIESAAQEFDDTIRANVSDKVARVLVVTDADERRITWLAPGQLERWKTSRDTVEQAAFANLDALLTRSAQPEVTEVRGAKLGMIPVSSVFKASVIFAPGFRAYVEPVLGWPVLAAVPSRDFIYVIPESDQELLGAMGRVIQQEFRESSYPISTEVLHLGDEGIEAIGAFPE